MRARVTPTRDVFFFFRLYENINISSREKKKSYRNQNKVARFFTLDTLSECNYNSPSLTNSLRRSRGQRVHIAVKFTRGPASQSGEFKGCIERRHFLPLNKNVSRE